MLAGLFPVSLIITLLSQLQSINIRTVHRCPCIQYVAFFLCPDSIPPFLPTSLRGGFKLSSRGWKRHLQGVAEISRGVAKKLRAIPFLSAFFVFYTLLIYAYFFLTF